jgi:hypothetical protein
LPENFPQLPENFRQLPENFPQLPENFRQLPENFPQLPENFRQLPENFRQLPENFPRSAQAPAYVAVRSKAPDLHRLAKPASGVDHQRASGNGFAFLRTVYFARRNRACKAGAFSYTCDTEYSLRRARGGGAGSVLPNLQFGSHEYAHL